jgi:succinyl-diaminopimelate desuccinylase
MTSQQVLKEKLFSHLDRQQNKVIEIQKSLVSIPALGPENGGSGEKDKADFLLHYLQESGLTAIREMPAADNRVESGIRPNIAAVLPGKDTEKTLWIISHLDVVPAGNFDLWTGDPFQLRVEGDLIYGRGTEDNHHGLVASLLAAFSFLENNVQPKCNIGLLFVADEESGNDYGLDFILKEHADLFKPEDSFLVPDFGTSGSDLIDVAEKSVFWLKISVLGKQCHASTPEKGINSLLACSALILKLQNLYSEFAQTDEIFQPPYSSFEATKKEANVPNVNTIPGKDVFYLDSRVLPCYSLQDIQDSVRAYADQIERDYSVKVELEVIQEESAPGTDPNSKIVKDLSEAIEEVYTIKPTAGGIGGGTVAAYIRRKYYPAVVWSTLLGNAHQAEEHTSIRNIINDAKVMTLLAI